MLEVHAPHEAAHGWRDFLLHLITITIGLFIALSLEALVEWQHHRHLVHESEASMQAEIENNSAHMKDVMSDLHQEQETLKGDIAVLHYIERNHRLPDNGSLDVSFRIVTFDKTSFRTAQNTGALAYMPYARAREYSEIYDEQAALEAAELVATRDTTVSLGQFLNMGPHPSAPSHEDAHQMEEHIEVLQGQLLYVSTLMSGLDQQYKSFLKAHPHAED